MPRKKPFSGKQKKKQLQDKRIQKQGDPKYLADLDDGSDEDNALNEQVETDQASLSIKTVNKTEGVSSSLLLNDFNVQKINAQPENDSRKSSSINNFRLHFFKDSEQAVERGKKESRKPVRFVDEKHMELGLTDVYPSDGVILDFPKRPTWNYRLSKEQLDAQEQGYFKEFVTGVIQQERSQELAYFELNLETWRQLWRVLEMSDVLLIICDARYPVLHTPPSLVRYIVQDLRKHVVIILNKIDFLPPLLVSLWKCFLESQMPGTRVVLFSSFLQELHDDTRFYSSEFTQGLYKKPRQHSSLPYGPAQLLDVCMEIVKGKVDLSSWRQKLKEDGFIDSQDGDPEQHDRGDVNQIPSKDLAMEGDVTEESKPQTQMSQESAQDQPRQTNHHFSNGILTLGCIGFPNAGKSSVLNTLVGKKVVSVSQTPGHTKHFQTIFLSPTVRLCDCPGLVFPSLIPKSLQVIAGIFPVAQVREPYSVVGYLAKRVNLPGILNLQPPDSSPKKRHKESGEYIWSAQSICEAWALKNGFTTAKAGRPDIYRAANKILRMAVEGQICLYFKPPNYSKQIDKAKSDPAIQQLCQFLRKTTSRRQKVAEAVSEEIEDDDENSDGEEDEEARDIESAQNALSFSMKDGFLHSCLAHEEDQEMADDDG